MIKVSIFLFTDLDVVFTKFLSQLFHQFRILFFFHSSSKSPASLLINLCNRSNTINSKVNHFFRSHCVDNFVCILKDIVEDLSFGLRLRFALGMETRMDNTVHVEVQVVDLRVFQSLLFKIFRMIMD